MNSVDITLRSDAKGVLREHRLVLLALSIMALVVLVYWPSFLRMVRMWTLTDYQYGWLVYPIATYVLWRKRDALAGASINASWSGVAMVAACVFAWILARTIGVQVLEFASVSLLPFAVFWSVAGKQALRAAAFPLGLLLAAVPTGEFLVSYLQEITADISSVLLNVAGVPVFREGVFMTLPGGSFEVAEVCGGLRYLLAALMASLAYAYLSYTGFAKRARFVACAGLTMVVTNGVRAFIVMFVASGTEMRVFAGKDHVWFGMVLFAAVFAGLIYFGERFAERNSQAEATSFTTTGGRSYPALIAVLLFVAAGPGLLYLQSRQPDPVVVTAVLPMLPGCEEPADWNRDWSPEFRNADHLQRASYDCGTHRAGVYFASYGSQEQGKELITSGNRIWPHDWRRYVDEAPIELTPESDVRQVYVDAPAGRMMIWYWYQVGDSVLANDLAVKVSTAVNALSLQPMEASVIAVLVEVPYEAGPDALRDLLEPKARTLMSWYRNNAGRVR